MSNPIKIKLTTSLDTNPRDYKVNVTNTVAKLKDNLCPVVGILDKKMMELRLINNNQLEIILAPDTSLLSEFNFTEESTLHVIDNSPAPLIDELKNEDVPKYKISDDKYNARQSNFRKFKQEQLEKKKNEEPSSKQNDDT